MGLAELLAGGLLIAVATVTVAIITSRANRSVERLRADVEKQKSVTADRAEDRAKYEGLLGALQADNVVIRARLSVLEARDLQHMAKVLAHLPWDHHAEDIAERAGVSIGAAPPLL